MSTNRNLVIQPATTSHSNEGTFTSAWVASQSAWRCWLYWRSADGSSYCLSTAGSSFSSHSGSAAVQRWLVTTAVDPCLRPQRCCSLQPKRRHNVKTRLGDRKSLWEVENRAGVWGRSKRRWLEKCTYSFSWLWLNEAITVLKWGAMHPSPGEELFLLHSLLENNTCTFWVAKCQNWLIKWSVDWN